MGPDEPGGQPAADSGARRRRAHRRVRRPGHGAAQPGDRGDISAADSDAAWGDAPDDEDRWLRDQKPPHW
jgi:hypothetical protein